MIKAVLNILSILFLFLTLASPCLAVSGHVGMDYDFMSGIWVWGVGLEKELTEHIAVGTLLEAHCTEICYKGPIPSWAPAMQRYEVWTEVRWKGFSVRLTDWCDHYLSQSEIYGSDIWGLNLGVKYTFR